MEFKVVLPDEGYEMIITVLGAEINLAISKDGKEVKNYEHLPIEILSTVHQTNTEETEDDEEEPEVVYDENPEEDGPEEDYDNINFEDLFGSSYEDLDQRIHEMGATFRNVDVIKRIVPVVKNNYQLIYRTSMDFMSAAADPVYETAIMSFSNGFAGLRDISDAVVREIGEGGGRDATSRSLIGGLRKRKRNRRLPRWAAEYDEM